MRSYRLISVRLCPRRPRAVRLRVGVTGPALDLRLPQVAKAPALHASQGVRAASTSGSGDAQLCRPCVGAVVNAFLCPGGPEATETAFASQKARSLASRRPLRPHLTRTHART